MVQFEEPSQDLLARSGTALYLIHVPHVWNFKPHEQFWLGKGFGCSYQSQGSLGQLGSLGRTALSELLLDLL